MRWDITSLVQSVNLIRPKMSMTPVGLNIFSLRQQGNTGNIFKTCFGLREQLWMDETSYNFGFQISNSAFIF